jgi:hypothetical protein
VSLLLYRQYLNCPLGNSTQTRDILSTIILIPQQLKYV